MLHQEWAHNKMIDDNWKEGLSADIKKDNKVIILSVNKLLPKTPKLLAECKGMVTADYQNFLEKEWLSSIRKGHEIKVNEEVLNSVK